MWSGNLQLTVDNVQFTIDKFCVNLLVVLSSCQARTKSVSSSEKKCWKFAGITVLGKKKIRCKLFAPNILQRIRGTYWTRTSDLCRVKAAL